MGYPDNAYFIKAFKKQYGMTPGAWREAPVPQEEPRPLKRKKPFTGALTPLERAARATLATQRHDWEQGVAAQAFLEAGDEDLAVAFAVEAVNRQAPDGRTAHLGKEISATDPCAVGEVLIYACEKTGAPELIKARDGLLDWALHGAPRNSGGIVYHLCGRREYWVDSFYMLPPFLARAGYYEEAMRQIDGWWEVLFLPEKGLLAHRYDEGSGRYVRADAWGAGNGWALAGMARVRSLLPNRMAEEKDRLTARIRLLLDSAKPYQHADGSFPNVLDDEGSFSEVNFGQMAAYTVYRGVKEGWLSKDYLPMAERAYRAALKKVDRFGFVRDVCGVPDFNRPGTAPEGQAFFLLMSAAREALGAVNLP